MKTCFVIAVCVLLSDGCWSRAVSEEESVVSVYTAPAGAAHASVYSQIANNLAEKITSPFYSFFGINNTTEPKKRTFEHIELQDPEPHRSITDGIRDRDVEELSDEAFKKTETKPEKVTLFSSYLPVISIQLKSDEKSNFGSVNETRNELDSDFDDEFGLDDVDDEETPRGPFVYLLELLGSIIQLLWGGFLAIFNPTTTSS